MDQAQMFQCYKGKCPITRVLFVPDDKSMIMLDSPLPAEELVANVNAGSWEPPPPYDYLTSNLYEGDTLLGSYADHVLYALQLDQLVIITLISRRILTHNRSSWERNWKVLYKKHASLYTNNTPEDDGALALSPRQMQVLRGLAEGLTTKQIALRLGLSPRTVRFHAAALKERFGASTRAESVGRAATLGLLEEN
jgi:DNA-binding CsgD family transcriptional regulator